jgi:hypothetical protein
MQCHDSQNKSLDYNQCNKGILSVNQSEYTMLKKFCKKKQTNDQGQGLTKPGTYNQKSANVTKSYAGAANLACINTVSKGIIGKSAQGEYVAKDFTCAKGIHPEQTQNAKVVNLDIQEQKVKRQTYTHSSSTNKGENLLHEETKEISAGKSSYIHHVCNRHIPKLVKTEKAMQMKGKTMCTRASIELSKVAANSFEDTNMTAVNLSCCNLQL